MPEKIATGIEALPHALPTAAFAAGELSRSARSPGDREPAPVRVRTRAWLSATKPPCCRRDRVAFTETAVVATAIGAIMVVYVVICWPPPNNLEMPMHHSYGYFWLAGGETLLAVLAEGCLAVEHLKWGAALGADDTRAFSWRARGSD